MKKIKKFLAGVLTLAMAMSMMTMTAFATEVSGDESLIPASSVSSIDLNANGKLTIHKKNYAGAEDTSFQNSAAYKGTGEEIDESNLPTGTTSLPNVTFMVYEVVSKNELADFYAGDQVACYDVEHFINSSDNSIKDEYSGKSVYTLTTDADGVASKVLPLGVYVVIETDAPDAVSAPAKPFLVSLPMTKVDGSGWLYDVHVYPKNATSVSEIEINLFKFGTDAGTELNFNGTSTIDPPTGAVILQGVKFILQKATKDASGNITGWNTITKATENGIDNSGRTFNLTTDDFGKITVSNLSVGTYRFIETDIGNNPGYIKDGEATYVFEIYKDAAGKFQVKYTAENAVRAYYSSGGSKLEDEYDTGNPSATPSASIAPNFVVVNERVEEEKTVVDGDANGNTSDYGVGDTITYQVEVGVPTKIAKMKTFYLDDTPTNLAIVKNTVKVFDGATEVTSGFTIAYKTDVTEVTNGSTGFRLDFTMGEGTAISGLAGKNITIKYDAIVLEAAATGDIIANGNDAKLTYSDKIIPTEEDNPNRTEKEKVYVRTDKAFAYTYKFKIAKYANNIGDDTLDGVEFDLYKAVNVGTTGAITVDEAGAWGLDTSKSWLKINATSLTTDANGIVIQGGLGNGDYCLVETKTKPGFNLLSKPVTVNLHLESTTTVAKEWQKIDNYTDGVLTFEGAWVEVATSTTTSYPDDGDDTADGIVTENVINRSGFTLPSTGGMGTFVFTFVGVAMMAAAVILFITSKKKETK